MTRRFDPGNLPGLFGNLPQTAMSSLNSGLPVTDMINDMIEGGDGFTNITNIADQFNNGVPAPNDMSQFDINMEMTGGDPVASAGMALDSVITPATGMLDDSRDLAGFAAETTRLFPGPLTEQELNSYANAFNLGEEDTEFFKTSVKNYDEMDESINSFPMMNPGLNMDPNDPVNLERTGDPYSGGPIYPYDPAILDPSVHGQIPPDELGNPYVPGISDLTNLPPYTGGGYDSSGMYDDPLWQHMPEDEHMDDILRMPPATAESILNRPILPVNQELLINPEAAVAVADNDIKVKEDPITPYIPYVVDAWGNRYYSREYEKEYEGKLGTGVAFLDPGILVGYSSRLPSFIEQLKQNLSSDDPVTRIKLEDANTILVNWLAVHDERRDQFLTGGKTGQNIFKGVYNPIWGEIKEHLMGMEDRISEEYDVEEDVEGDGKFVPKLPVVTDSVKDSGIPGDKYTEGVVSDQGTTGSPWWSITDTDLYGELPRSRQWELAMTSMYPNMYHGIAKKYLDRSYSPTFGDYILSGGLSKGQHDLIYGNKDQATVLPPERMAWMDWIKNRGQYESSMGQGWNTALKMGEAQLSPDPSAYVNLEKNVTPRALGLISLLRSGDATNTSGQLGKSMALAKLYGSEQPSDALYNTATVNMINNLWDRRQLELDINPNLGGMVRSRDADFVHWLSENYKAWA